MNTVKLNTLSLEALATLANKKIGLGTYSHLYGLGKSLLLKTIKEQLSKEEIQKIEEDIFSNELTSFQF